MANFESFLNTILLHEGGYQNNIYDSGNFNSEGENIGTNYGISAPVLEYYLGYIPTEEDMINIPMYIVSEIYRIEYWNKINGDFINDQQIAEIIGDHAVNAGVYSASKIVQDVLNTNYNFTLVVDGIIGNNTLNAINSVNQENLFNDYKEARISYYNSLNNQHFIDGWLTRVESFSYARGNNNALKKGVLFSLMIFGGFKLLAV